jgi:hypothetical protein
VILERMFELGRWHASRDFISNRDDLIYPLLGIIKITFYFCNSGLVGVISRQK